MIYVTMQMTKLHMLVISTTDVKISTRDVRAQF